MANTGARAESSALAGRADRAIELWLRDEVVPAALRALSVEQVREHLAHKRAVSASAGHYRVAFAPEVRDKFDDIEVRIAPVGAPATAARYVDAIVDLCANLATFPWLAGWQSRHSASLHGAAL